MKTEDKEILCSLIRDHEDTVGSSRVTMMAIKAFIESIKQVRCSFANTLKFSHRHSSQQRIHRKVESKTHGDVSFQLITHSHDTVDLKHVDFLVTEDGIKDKAAIAAWIQSSRGHH